MERERWKLFADRGGSTSKTHIMGRWRSRLSYRGVLYNAIRRRNDLLDIGGVESRMRNGCGDAGEIREVCIQ